MANKVEIKTSADAAAALSNFDKVITKQRGMIAELKKTARESRRAASAGRQMTQTSVAGSETMVGSIGKTIASYASLGAAVGLVTKGMRDQLALAREALRENEAVAISAARAVRATADIFKPGELAETVKQIAASKGVAEQEIYRAFEAAAPSGMKLGQAGLTEAVTYAADYASVYGDKAALIAPAIAQVAEAGGVSPGAALGFMTRAKTGLQVKDFESLMSKVAPSLVGATRAGGTLEGALELSTMLQAAQPELRGTSAKMSADVFQRLFQEAAIPTMGEGGKLEYRTLEQVAPGVETFAEARGVVQRQLGTILEDQRADALTKLLTGTGGSRAMLRRLYTGEAGALGEYERTQAAIAGPSEADVGVVTGGIAAAEQIPSVALALAKGQAETMTDITERGRTEQASLELARKTLSEFRRAGGMDWAQRQVASGWDWATMGEGDAIGALQEARRQVEAPRQRRQRPFTGSFTDMVGRIADTADVGGVRVEDRQLWIDRFDEMIRLLQGIERSNEETERNTAKAARNGNGEHVIRPALGAADVEP